MLLCVVVARSLGNFRALLLSNSVALGLILILSLSDRHLLALLLGYRVAHLPGHLPLNLVLDSVALLLVVVLSDLFVLGGALLLVLCVALFFGYTVALLSGNILAVLLGYILFSLSATSTNNTVPLALSALYDMLIKRKKKVSKGRVLAFTKRVGTLALQLDHAGCVGSLSMLRQLHTTHVYTGQLLDSEHEVGSGVFDPTLPDPEHCCASNTTGWEHSLLESHYHPTCVRMSRHVVSGCPSQGERSLPTELRGGPDTLYTDYCMDTMVFNPAVQPPPKKQKRGKTTPISSDMILPVTDMGP